MTNSKIAVITRLSTQNAGNEALSRELIRMLDAHPNSEVRAIDRYPVYFEHMMLDRLGRSKAEICTAFDKLADSLVAKANGRSSVLAPIAAESLVHLNESARELPGTIKKLKRAIGYRRNLAALGLIGQEETSQILNTVAWSDLVVWNPAGEFHPTGNPHQTFRILLLMRVAQKLGKKTAIINHSLEVADDRLQIVVEHVYRKTDFIAVREVPSREKVLELGVDPAKAHVVPDLVFLASTYQIDKTTDLDIKPGAIGFSINGLEAFKGKNEWDSLFEKLKSFERQFVYVSNAANHDLEVFHDMARKHGGLVIDRQPNYYDLRTVFSRVDVLISSRLHSSILSLCEGTPVVTIEPSVFKLTGIFAALQYPIPTKNLNTEGWSDQVADAVKQILADKARISAEGTAGLNRQVEIIRAAYEQMYGLLDEAKSTAAA